MGTARVAPGEKIGTLPTPTRGGYDFAGWYTRLNGGAGVQVTENTVIQENTTLYAHWANKLYIGDRFIDPGPENSTDPVLKGFDTEIPNQIIRYLVADPAAAHTARITAADKIDGVAVQSNILALPAAIEKRRLRG